MFSVIYRLTWKQGNKCGITAIHHEESSVSLTLPQCPMISGGTQRNNGHTKSACAFKSSKTFPMLKSLCDVFHTFGGKEKSYRKEMHWLKKCHKVVFFKSSCRKISVQYMFIHWFSTWIHHLLRKLQTVLYITLLCHMTMALGGWVGFTTQWLVRWVFGDKILANV